MPDEEFSALLVGHVGHGGSALEVLFAWPAGREQHQDRRGLVGLVAEPVQASRWDIQEVADVASACGVIGRGGVRTGDLSPVAGALAIGSAITGLLTPLYLVRAPRPGHGPHPHRPTPTTSRQLNRNRDVCTAEGSQVRILPTAWLLRMCHQRSAPNSCP